MKNNDFHYVSNLTSNDAGLLVEGIALNPNVQVNSTDIAVLRALADRFYGVSGHGYTLAGIDDIAAVTRFTRRAINRVMSHLKDLGFIFSTGTYRPRGVHASQRRGPAPTVWRFTPDFIIAGMEVLEDAELRRGVTTKGTLERIRSVVVVDSEGERVTTMRALLPESSDATEPSDTAPVSVDEALTPPDWVVADSEPLEGEFPPDEMRESDAGNPMPEAPASQEDVPHMREETPEENAARVAENRRQELETLPVIKAAVEEVHGKTVADSLDDHPDLDRLLFLAWMGIGTYRRKFEPKELLVTALRRTHEAMNIKMDEKNSAKFMADYVLNAKQLHLTMAVVAPESYGAKAQSHRAQIRGTVWDDRVDERTVSNDPWTAKWQTTLTEEEAREHAAQQQALEIGTADDHDNKENSFEHSPNERDHYDQQ